MSALDGMAMPLLLIVLVTLVGAGVAAVAVARRPGRDPSTVVQAAAAVCLLGAVGAVVWSTIGGGGRFATDGSLVPLRSIRAELTNPDSLLGWINIAGNAVLFAPIGFLVPLAVRRRWITGVVAAAVLSVLIEGCQWLLQVGAGDIDDVLLNTLGGLAGGLLAAVVQRMLVRRADAQRV